MKSLSDRNPFTVGLVGLAVTAAIVVGAVEYDKLPFMQSGTTYQAYFAEAGGLTSGAEVHVAGYRVGRRRLNLGVWKHGVSVYGWRKDRDGGFVAAHPRLSSGKGTIRISPRDAEEISDEELRALLGGALDP